MNKKRTSIKRELTFNIISKVKLNESKIKKLNEFKPEDFFKNHNKIANALLQCLIENDTESFIEILNSYLMINKLKISQDTKLSRTTIQDALSKKGNPTLKTIAKIIHSTVNNSSNNQLYLKKLRV